jgi:hypothetical protein
MGGERIVSLEVFAVGGDPVGGDILLGGGEFEAAVADHGAETIFESVFDAGVPGAAVGLGPEIFDGLGAAEGGGDQVIDFVGAGLGILDAVAGEDLGGEGAGGDTVVVGSDGEADFGAGDGLGGAGGEAGGREFGVGTGDPAEEAEEEGRGGGERDPAAGATAMMESGEIGHRAVELAVALAALGTVLEVAAIAFAVHEGDEFGVGEVGRHRPSTWASLSRLRARDAATVPSEISRTSAISR